MPPGMVHQDAAHGLGGHPEELGPVLPARLALVDQPQVGLVDEGGGLQGVAGVLAPEVALGLAVQLVVDDGHELVQGGGVTTAPGLEQTRHVVPGGRHTMPASSGDQIGEALPA